MVSINLGSLSTGHVEPAYAYGLVRSSSVITDALFLTIQGYALGILFGNPHLGAAMGAVISLTDRIFSILINAIVPGNSTTLLGVPLGLKNISLAALSMTTAFKVLKGVTNL